MARKEDIVNSIWRELDHLSNDAIQLYIWSWTNERCGMAGIYQVPRRLLLEGRLDDAALDAALAELRADGKLLYADGVLWNIARVKRIATRSKQIATAIEKDLAEIPTSHQLFSAFVERYEGTRFADRRLTFTRPSPDPQKFGSTTTKTRGSSDPQSRVQGQGQGQGSGRGQGPGSSLDHAGRAREPFVAAHPAAFETAGRIAEVKGCALPQRHRMNTLMAEYPEAEHERIASACEDWWCHGRGANRRMRDVIAALRRSYEFDAANRRGVAGKGSIADHSDEIARHFGADKPESIDAEAEEVAK